MDGAGPVSLRRALAVVVGSALLHVGAAAGGLLLASRIDIREPLFIDFSRPDTPPTAARDEPPPPSPPRREEPTRRAAARSRRGSATAAPSLAPASTPGAATETAPNIA